YPKTASRNASTDCCSWDGVICDEYTNQVVLIDFSSSQFYDTMVFVWSLVLSLHFLFLYSLLSFTFTSSFSLTHPNCRQYESHALLQFKEGFNINKTASYNPLSLAVNFLQLKSSSLKSIIHNSTKLESLLLDYVTISSSLPDKLTNLTSLKALSLSNSELYGEFPVRIFHLPNLKFLDLRYNPNLIGRLPEFQSNSVLTKLALDETGFYGTLPVSIGKLSSLNILSIPSCHFIGYIPSSIDNLTQLIQINLQHNKFRGDPSSSLANLTKLTLLNVGFNEFTFETISWIGEVSSIITLDICSVNIG
ncbi:hypothetical protein RYX36_000284, partial [Vicia faba]